jgi:3-hydroxyisobutyrate dehydrogenase-like beta-hydroxyacid dehydrogenase
MQHVGLVGVGFIGKLFVDSIADADLSLSVYDVDPGQAAYATERGANSCESPAEVARAADAVVLSVPGAPEVREVMEGENGALPELDPDQLVVDTTTTGPEVAREYERKCGDRNVTYLTAPLTRGAADPGIHMMVGGTEEAYAEAGDLLDVLSAAHARVGDPGQAQTFKLGIQLRYAGREALDAEVVSFVSDNGVDPGIMNDFLGFGVDERYFGDDFSQTIEGLGGLRIWHKDIGYALELAHDTGSALPLSSDVHEAYKHAVRSIDDDEGHAAALIRYWRRLNDDG